MRNIDKESELESTLRNIGINLFYPFTRKWKSLDRILREISKKWNKLSEKDQDDLSILMCGHKDAAEFQVSIEVLS